MCPQRKKVENVLSQSPFKWDKIRLGMKESEILPWKKKKKKDSNGQYNMSKELPDLKYKRLSQRS